MVWSGDLQWYEVHVELVDKGGNITRRTYRLRAVDDAGDVSALVTQMTNLMNDLQGVSNAAIKRVSLAGVYVTSGGFSLPNVGEVEELALITGAIDGHPLKSGTLTIPAPKDGVFVGSPGQANYNIVDFTDSALGSFVGEFQGGSSAFLISDGEAIDPPYKGKRVHRHSVRG